MCALCSVHVCHAYIASSLRDLLNSLAHLGASEIDQKLRVLVPLTEDLSLVPIVNIWSLTPANNSKPRTSKDLSWPPLVPPYTHIQHNIK